MKKSIAITAILVCILAGIGSGIIGCADRNASETTETTETIGAIAPLAPVPTRNLTAEITAQTIEPAEITDTEAAALTQFALDLAAEQDGQFLLSPVSIASALAMTANGADGDTLSQTEDVLGLDRDSLNRVIHGYMAKNGDDISLANSIWFRDDGFEPNRGFLQTAVDRYGADIFTAPFDGSTLADVNAWISEKTGGMIPQMLDKIRPDTVMYLINAVYFEQQWSTVYDFVSEGKFTTADGDTQDVSTLRSVEDCYYEDEHAVGFAKAYKWCDYSFVALLPEEGMTPAEYLAQVTGEELHELLKHPQNVFVQTETPKFKAEYGTDLVKNLTALGMTDIFDDAEADLTGLGTASGNLYVSDVAHKAVMELDESGTKAAAATIVAVVEECEIIPPEPEKTVILDRPFVYMIVDNTTGIPLFLGTLESVE
ncbi:MAG: serpin family protein [Clostridia bacterium]|nr:serpin family protein [Clostridia bacterium]